MRSDFRLILPFAAAMVALVACGDDPSSNPMDDGGGVMDASIDSGGGGNDDGGNDGGGGGGGGGGGSDAGNDGGNDGGGGGCTDTDNDTVCDNVDACPGSDDRDDADNDGVPDGCDLCANSDDTVDMDNDGVADGCDICPGFDDNGTDTDNDGVPNDCDICGAGDDNNDNDNDGVPDACDVCALGDDNDDNDSDNVPDACDICALGDDSLDADSDGVPDACDKCADFDDSIDYDQDGTPDLCDSCGFGRLLTEEPLYAYRLGESSTMDPAADSSGNGFDATYVNGERIGLGLLGGATDDDTAAYFGRGVATRVELNPVTSFPVDAFTVAFWVRGNQSGDGTILSYAVTGNDNEMLIYNTDDLRVLIDGAERDTNVNVNDDRWHYVAVRWSSNSGLLDVWVDKVKVYNSGGSPFQQGATIEGGGSMVIAQEQDSVGGSFSNSQAFEGRLDDLVIFDRLVSKADLDAFYNTNSCSRGACVGGVKNGSSPSCSAKSCAELLSVAPGAQDGVYWLDPDGGFHGDPIQTTCDMTTDGGGWTLVHSTAMGATRVTGAAEVPQAPVVAGTSTYMDPQQAKALAALSHQVHLRTAGMAATRSATSVYDSSPITDLAAGNLVNISTNAQVPLWTPAAGFDISNLMNYSCVPTATYPSIYHACGNAAGLHLVGAASRWEFQGGDNNLNEPMETYVK